MEPARSIEEDVAKAVAIEDAMQIGSEDAVVVSNAAVIMTRIPEFPLTIKFGERFGSVKISGLADMNFIAADSRLRYNLAKETASDHPAGGDARDL